MSQPPFQPPPPPAQPPQPPQQQAQNPYNPYAQPAPPQQQQQQQPGFGPPPAPGQPPQQPASAPVPGQTPMYPGQAPVPGQAPGQAPGQPMYPMQPAPPFQAPPFGQQLNTQGGGGQPVGAVFLGFFASVVVSLLYSVLNMVTYKDQSETAAHILYVAHALLNGVAVGVLVGLVGRRSPGAWFCAAVIAPLGAFFGYTNSIPLIIGDSQGTPAIGDMMEEVPFLPAKTWWGTQYDTRLISLLGLLVAALAGWALAYAVGKKRSQA
ncbi:hypothetical protein ACFYO2_21410 [Streptomyces sp. NPDC006602]|uniref:hypothetical protein n=1 Tax=Streptomyces sp. NPDC006602 TaxID=3364751 RepID=UPI0036893F5F